MAKVSPEFDAAAHVAHMAPVIGLTIDEAWRAGVVANMAATARAAALVAEFALDDHIDPAPRFEP